MAYATSPNNVVESRTAIDSYGKERRSLEKIYSKDSYGKEREVLEKTYSDSSLKRDFSADVKNFNPLITDFEVSNNPKSQLKNFMGINVDPVNSYYNVWRTEGYLAQAFTAFGASLIAEKALGVHGEDNHKNPEALKMFYRGEAALICSVAALMTGFEYKKMMDDFSLTLAIEFGKDKENVNFMDLVHSENPIVEIERSRMLWKTLSRASSGLGYLGGLTCGLTFGALNISAERTLFYADTPYDILVKAINEVQFNHLQGEVVQENLVGKMQKAMQGMYSDRGRNVLSEKDMHDLYPTLQLVALDIINKRIGVESIFGILGGGIIVIGDPHKTEVNYNIARELQMDPVVDIAKYRRGSSDERNIWDSQVLEKRGEVDRHGVATTARSDFVGQEKARIAESDFRNMGINF